MTINFGSKRLVVEDIQWFVLLANHTVSRKYIENFFTPNNFNGDVLEVLHNALVYK